LTKFAHQKGSNYEITIIAQYKVQHNIRSNTNATKSAITYLDWLI